MTKNKSKTRFFKFIVLLMDAAIIYGSYLVGMLIKFGQIAEHEVFEEMRYLLIGIVVVELTIIYIYGLYHDLYKSNEEIIVSVLVTLGLTTLATLIYIFLDEFYVYSRFVIVYAVIIQFILISSWHILAHRISIRMHGLIRVMIVGGIDEATDVAIKLMAHYDKRYDILYMIEPGEIDSKGDLLNQVDALVICGDMPLEDKDHIRHICSKYSKSLFVIPRIYDITIKHTKWQQFDDIAVLTLTGYGMSMDERIAKRGMDIILSLLAMIVLLPVALIVGIIIKMDSKGPVLFKQERMTKDNKSFYIRKFRTMEVGAEAETGPILATVEDDRITKVGKGLRRSRLDEIPQLWNVFVGHMSLVGPRPERPHFIESFKEEVPGFEYRLKVKAGLTGLAQVMGKYTTTPTDKLRYDMIYINSYTVLLDIRILIQTMRIVFMGERAKGLDEDRKSKYLIRVEEIRRRSK